MKEDTNEYLYSTDIDDTWLTSFYEACYNSLDGYKEDEIEVGLTITIARFKYEPKDIPSSHIPNIVEYINENVDIGELLEPYIDCTGEQELELQQLVKDVVNTWADNYNLNRKMYWYEKDLKVVVTEVDHDNYEYEFERL